MYSEKEAVRCDGERSNVDEGWCRIYAPGDQAGGRAIGSPGWAVTAEEVSVHPHESKELAHAS
jgi:hypothetical protein